jgi:hypothetical protein
MTRSRLLILAAIALVVLVAMAIWLGTRKREPDLESALAAQAEARRPKPGPIVQAVELSGGLRAHVDEDRKAFAISALATKSLVVVRIADRSPGQDWTLTGVELVEFDDIDRTDAPLGKLPAETAGPAVARIEIPAGRIQRGRVYKLMGTIRGVDQPEQLCLFTVSN